MYPPKRTWNDAASQGPSDEGRAQARSGRESFRPVALPALAAAVQITRSAAQSARAKLATRPRIVHEDEPAL